MTREMTAKIVMETLMATVNYTKMIILMFVAIIFLMLAVICKYVDKIIYVVTDLIEVTLDTLNGIDITDTVNEFKGYFVLG